MAGTSRARRSMVGARCGDPNADGDVVEHDGQSAAGLGHGPEVLEDAGLGRSVVVRRDHQDTVDPARGGQSRSSATEWSVSFEPVPATTGMVTASATARHSSTFSSSVSTELSPVEPLSTRPSLPCSASQRAEVDRGLDVQRPGVVEGRHHGGDHPARTVAAGDGAHRPFTLPAGPFARGGAPEVWR